MPPKRKPTWLWRTIRWIVRIAALIILSFFLLSVLLVLSLRWIDPPTSAFMLIYERTYGKPVQYRWVDRQQISEHLAIAAIAAEDQRFPDHHGLDFTEIENALTNYINGKRLRGASTISQQVVKNLFLWNGRSLSRKLLELYFTGMIEWLWGKERILEIYLNIVEFGGGVYGVQSASERYFGRPAKAITLSQACLMIAVLPSPDRYNLMNPSQYHRQRAQAIEKSVQRLGGIRYLRKD